MIVMLLRFGNCSDEEALLWIAWIALCISVMTTKQHFFFDLVTGIITGIACWYWMCIPCDKASSNEEWVESLPQTISLGRL